MRVKSEVKKSRKIFTQNHPKSHLQRCELTGGAGLVGLIFVCLKELIDNNQPSTFYISTLDT